jgi:hypothetical protein
MQILKYIDTTFTHKPGHRVHLKNKFDNNLEIINYYLNRHNVDNPIKYFNYPYLATPCQFFYSFKISNDNYIKSYCNGKLPNDDEIEKPIIFLNLIKLMLIKLEINNLGFINNIISKSIKLNKLNSIYIKDKNIKELYFFKLFAKKSINQIVSVVDDLGLSLSDLCEYISLQKLEAYKGTEVLSKITSKDYVREACKRMDDVSALKFCENDYVAVYSKMARELLKINPHELLERYTLNNNNIHELPYDFVEEILKYGKITNLTNNSLLFMLNSNILRAYKILVNRNMIKNNDIAQKVISIAIEINNNYVINDCIDKGCSISNNIVAKYIHKICKEVIVFQLLGNTLNNLLTNVKNLNVSKIFTELGELYGNKYEIMLGYQRHYVDNEYLLFIVDKLVSRIDNVTYDIVQLFVENLEYIPNLEKYGLEYGDALYKKLYAIGKIPLYYLNRFTHVTKQKLAIRYYFTNYSLVDQYFDEDLKNKNKFILENIDIKRSANKFTPRTEYIQKMKSVDGYTLQNMYDNFYNFYFKIKDKYGYLPVKYRSDLDYDALNKMYSRVE